MVMKVCIPVNHEGTEIFVRTGHTPWFAVYEFSDDDKNWNHTGRIQNAGHDEEHHHGADSDSEVEHHRKQIQGLRGCDTLLCLALGAHMKAALDEAGIGYRVYKKKEIRGIDQLLTRFQEEVSLPE